MTKTDIEHALLDWRPTASLRVHPIVSTLPAMPEDGAEFKALVADVAAHGIQQALLVTPQGDIIDGRHRWRAASLAGLAKVPCQTVSPKDNAEIIGLALRTLAHRRHYTAGQIALIAYPALADARKAAIEARNALFEANSKKGFGPAYPLLADREKSTTYTDSICSELAISRDTFDRAARLFDIFDLSDDLAIIWQADILADADLEEGRAYTARQAFWPRLMRREKPLGLGQAIAGLCGRPEIDQLLIEAKRGKARKAGRPTDADMGITGVRKQLELFSEQWGKEIKVRAAYWTKFSEDERAQACEAIDRGLSAAPEDFLRTLKKRIAKELASRGHQD